MTNRERMHCGMLYYPSGDDVMTEQLEGFRFRRCAGGEVLLTF